MNNLSDNCRLIPLYNKNTGKIMDVIDVSKTTLINNYILAKDYNDKKKICSICELKKYLEKMVTVSVNNLNYEPKVSSASGIEQDNFDLSFYTIINEEKEMIINQLVIDILFDKYLDDPKKVLINRSAYCKYMAQLYTDTLYHYGKNIENTIDPDAVREKIQQKMEKYSGVIESSELRDEVSKLGIDPEKYIEYCKPPKTNSKTKCRPKYAWDFFFYNSYMLSGKQYNRKKLRSTYQSKNYTYEEKIEDIKLFHSFAGAILSPDRIVYNNWNGNKRVFDDAKGNSKESAEDFFIKMMEYYYLESYKRVGFMLRYANYLMDISEDTLKTDDSFSHILKWFHPIVVYPRIEKDNTITEYCTMYKYYRPLLFIEDRLLNCTISQNTMDTVCNLIQLRKFQVIRARAYELFKFHAQFVSDDYDDIKHFIDTSYNLRQYHETVNVDQYLECTSGESKHNAKKFIKRFIILNQYLFPDSGKRKPKTKKSAEEE